MCAVKCVKMSNCVVCAYLSFLEHNFNCSRSELGCRSGRRVDMIFSSFGMELFLTELLAMVGEKSKNHLASYKYEPIIFCLINFYNFMHPYILVHTYRIENLFMLINVFT